MARDHLRSAADPTLTLCGEIVRSPAWSGGELPIVDTLASAEHPCSRCARLDATREPVFERTAPERVRFGAGRSRAALHDLTPEEAYPVPERRASDGEVAQRWISTWQAIRDALKYRGEREAGASLPSSSDPARFGIRIQEARDPSRGGREHSQIDRYAATLAIVVRASRDADVIAVARGIGLDGDQAREIVEAYLGGRWRWVPVRKGGKASKGRVKEHVIRSPESVAADVTERFGVEVSPGDVQQIARAFVFYAQDVLIASGVVGSRESEPEGMAKWAANLRKESGNG